MRVRRRLPVFFVVVLCALMAEWAAALIGLSLGGAWLWVLLNFVSGALAGGVAVSLTSRNWSFFRARTGLLLATSRWATFVLVPDLFAHPIAFEGVVALLAPSLLVYVLFVVDGRRVTRSTGFRTSLAPDS